MNDTLVIIVFFIAVAIVMLIVGFIGNKIVDGATNAARSKKIQQQKNNPQYGKTESLAARYNGAQPNRTVMPQQPPAPKAKFCTKCGNRLSEGAQFCNKCGTRAEN